MQINSAKDLKVYKAAYALAMRIFEVTKRFPPEEKVCADQPSSPIVTISVLEFA